MPHDRVGFGYASNASNFGISLGSATAIQKDIVPTRRSLLSQMIPARRRAPVAALLIGILALSLLGHLVWVRSQMRRSLAESHLPLDLASQQQLQVLELPKGVALNGWLPKELRVLLASRASVDSLDGLPPSLESLDVSGAPVARLGGLPDSLQVLDVSWTSLRDLDLVGLPSRLQSLTLAGDQIQDLSVLPGSLVTLSLTQTGADLRGLPAGLRNLSLSGPGFDSLDGLPVSLESLALTGTRVRTIEDLPSSVRSLELVGNDDLRLDRLPLFLTKLVLAGGRLPDLQPLRYLSGLDVSRAFLPAGALLPDTISDLWLNGGDLLNGKGPLSEEDLEKRAAVLRGLPLSLKALALVGGTFEDLSALPSNVVSLNLNWYSRPVPPKLPSSVRALNLSWSAVTSLKGLPDGLRELDVSASDLVDLSELARLRHLETLRFRWAKVQVLPAIPETVTTLDLGGSRDLAVLPVLSPGLQSLDVSQTRLETLPANLDSLRVLDISNTAIRDLRRLPRHLEVLTLSRGQVKNLEGLPSTVHSLHIVEGLGEP